MKCIEQVAQEDWFKAKGWLVVGTGESIKDFKPEYFDRFNVWTINGAIQHLKKADIVGMSDHNIHSDLYRRHKRILSDGFVLNSFKSKYILTRSNNLRDDNHPNTIYINLECDKMTPFGKVFKCQNSSSIPFNIFHDYFPHTVHTLGFDGGTKVSELAGDRYKSREDGIDFSVHHGGMIHWSRNYKVIKL